MGIDLIHEHDIGAQYIFHATLNRRSFVQQTIMAMAMQ